MLAALLARENARACAMPWSAMPPRAIADDGILSTDGGGPPTVGVATTRPDAPPPPGEYGCVCPPMTPACAPVTTRVPTTGENNSPVPTNA
jgi:hypothetical protein